MLGFTKTANYISDQLPASSHINSELALRGALLERSIRDLDLTEWDDRNIVKDAIRWFKGEPLPFFMATDLEIKYEHCVDALGICAWQDKEIKERVKNAEKNLSKLMSERKGKGEDAGGVVAFYGRCLSAEDQTIQRRRIIRRCRAG